MQPARLASPLLAWALVAGLVCACGGEARPPQAKQGPEGAVAEGRQSAPDPRAAQPRPGTPSEGRLAEALRVPMDLVAAERFEEAFDLAQAYGQSPGSLMHQAEFMQGYARHKAKRHAAAREHLERAIRLAPDYHPSWHFLGFACHALGDLDRAEQAFSEHARLSPGEGDDAFGLALVALDRDDLERAELQLKRAGALHAQAAARGLDRRRELAKVATRLADVYARRDDWEQARTALVTAVQHFGGHDEIWHKLYQAHLRLGEDALAAEALAARDTLRARDVESR